MLNILIYLMTILLFQVLCLDGWSGDVWGNDFNDNLQLQGEVNSLQKELSRLRSECSRYKSVVEELVRQFIM